MAPSARVFTPLGEAIHRFRQKIAAIGKEVKRQWKVFWFPLISVQGARINLTANSG
jgi:hypothetical protein